LGLSTLVVEDLWLGGFLLGLGLELSSLEY
jgi:hypothetical protein